MAAEAQAEAPALAPAPPPPSSPASPEKRGLPVPGDDGGLPSEEEEVRPLLPEPKRRRACVDALDGVPGAAAAPSVPGWLCDGDGACFSFQPARAGFAAPETTPKFGSFNPPGEAELAVAGLDLKAAEPGADSEGSPEAEDEVAAASAAREAAQVKDEGSLSVGGEVDGQAQT